LGDATCSFLGRLNPLNPSRFERYPPATLHALLGESCELARSLEDRVAMIIHLDIEYVNFDDPAAAFLDLQRIFLLQQPLVEVIETRLLALGIRFLHVVTGQGHHFVWKIRKTSPVAKAIARLGIATAPDPHSAVDPLFSQLSLLMEYLAHLVKLEFRLSISALILSSLPTAVAMMSRSRCSDCGRQNRRFQGWNQLTLLSGGLGNMAFEIAFGVAKTFANRCSGMREWQ
jgi:hypothetical protein